MVMISAPRQYRFAKRGRHRRCRPLLQASAGHVVEDAADIERTADPVGTDIRQPAEQAIGTADVEASEKAA
jgi:hypothetical protein